MEQNRLLTALRNIPPSWRHLLGWGLVLAAPAAQLWLVHRYAVNVPIWDEWALVPFLQEVHEGGDWWAWVFRQHNEHRVAVLRLPLVLIAEWSDWNVVPQMYFGILLQLLTLLGLWRILAPSLDRDPLRFAPVAALSFGLIGYQIFLYGMMFVWSALVAAIVWSLWWLSRQTWLGLAAAAACGIVASFSLNNGLLVWPIGLALLFVGRDAWGRRLAWLAVGIAVFAFYYWDYSPPGNHPPLSLALSRPFAVTAFMLANLGTAYGAGSYWASVGFGAGLAFLVATTWARWLLRWREWTREERTMLGLAAFGLLSTASIGLARATMGRDFALEPRYTCLTILVSIALYSHLFGYRRKEWHPGPLFGAAFAALLVVGYIGTTLHAREQIKTWSNVRQLQVVQLDQIDTLADEALAGIFFAPEQLRELVAYMRPRRLGPFHEPLGFLRLVGWQEGSPAAEIVTDRSVVQTFSCPVETMVDLAVPFATYQRTNNGTVTLRLTDGDLELARREIAAARVEDNAWVRLSPDVPLADCRGRRLTLTVSSDNALEGTGVTVWTYPAYYDGQLYQADGPDLSGRSLGLEINRAPS